MVEYEPLDSGVEVNGQTVLSVVNGLPEILQDRGHAILAENGIADPREGSWHPQEEWLAAFAQLNENMGESALERIGEEIPESADWPEGVDSVSDGIESIDTAYHMNHRGGDIGNYEAIRVDDNRIHVVCDNPYPCAFDTGILRGVVQVVGEDGARIQEIGDGCRSSGGSECRYEIEW